ncbi:MAG: hypothetical protein ABSH01_16160 [Terriglobia bacterium]
MRMKIEDVEVADPQEAMRKFKAALAHVVRVPKITRDTKRAAILPKKKRKG